LGLVLLLTIAPTSWIDYLFGVDTSRMHGFIGSQAFMITVNTMFGAVVFGITAGILRAIMKELHEH